MLRRRRRRPNNRFPECRVTAIGAFGFARGSPRQPTPHQDTAVQEFPGAPARSPARPPIPGYCRLRGRAGKRAGLGILKRAPMTTDFALFAGLSIIALRSNRSTPSQWTVFAVRRPPCIVSWSNADTASLILPASVSMCVCHQETLLRPSRSDLLKLSDLSPLTQNFQTLKKTPLARMAVADSVQLMDEVGKRSVLGGNRLEIEQ